MPVPAGGGPWPYAVTLDEVKLHGNITTSASDGELVDFIGTAQQMVEKLVGVTVPQTFTQTVVDAARPGSTNYVWLRHQPVMAVTSVSEYGNTVDPGLYYLDTDDGSLARLDRRGWYGAPEWPLTVVYQAGRLPVPEAIRWGIKELTIHLWRSTQAQRGGRARGGEQTEFVAGYALPYRVRDALDPFLLAPVLA